ncbi:RtcB family protein [candidate division WOR-3 bacterium]|nr:RtcB family protein [candidate division WOR-3 bacterium]
MKLISKNIWQIPREGKMRVPAFIVASDKIAKHIELGAIEQLKNVATLPGIVKGAFAMPDIHQGYGFPIGGVAAFDIDNGIVSPGGVGYDINCGVRMLTSNITYNEIKPFLNKILSHIYSSVPCGIGSKGKINVSRKDLKEILENGVNWAIKSGFGKKEDIESIEDRGKINGANPDLISERAVERGLPQVGSLGAGNHFIEIQTVKEIFNKNIADEFGIKKDNITILFGGINPTIDKNKGYKIFLDALKKIINKNITVIVFGNKKRKFFKKDSINFYFLGKISNDHQLRKIYSAADLTVVPSKIEVFGQVITESMACGTPVVAFNSTGPAEIIIHKENGYLAKPFDPEDIAKGINWIIDDQSRYKNLSKNAREHAVGNYSDKIIAGKYLNLYNKMLLSNIK